MVTKLQAEKIIHSAVTQKRKKTKAGLIKLG